MNKSDIDKKNLLEKIAFICWGNELSNFKKAINNIPVKDLFTEVSEEAIEPNSGIFSIWHVVNYTSDNPEFIQILLNKIINSDYPFDIDIPIQKGELKGWTAYHLALDYNQTKIMKILADNSANPNLVFKAKNPTTMLEPHTTAPAHPVTDRDIIKAQFESDKSQYDLKSSLNNLAKKVNKQDKSPKIFKI